MYALIALLFILGIVWSIFLARVFMNLKRDHEIKSHTQKYYDSKITEFYGKVEKTKEGEETEGTYSATINTD